MTLIVNHNNNGFINASAVIPSSNELIISLVVENSNSIPNLK